MSCDGVEESHGLSFFSLFDDVKGGPPTGDGGPSSTAAVGAPAFLDPRLGSGHAVVQVVWVVEIIEIDVVQPLPGETAPQLWDDVGEPIPPPIGQLGGQQGN